MRTINSYCKFVWKLTLLCRQIFRTNSKKVKSCSQSLCPLFLASITSKPYCTKKDIASNQCLCPNPLWCEIMKQKKYISHAREVESWIALHAGLHCLISSAYHYLLPPPLCNAYHPIPCPASGGSQQAPDGKTNSSHWTLSTLFEAHFYYYVKNQLAKVMFFFLLLDRSRLSINQQTS